MKIVLHEMATYTHRQGARQSTVILREEIATCMPVLVIPRSSICFTSGDKVSH